jgi:hypothetical protein
MIYPPGPHLAPGVLTGQPYNDADGPWSAGTAFGKTSRGP